MKFVTEISYEDTEEMVEVVSELPPKVAARAEEIYALVGGHMSHEEIVAAAKASA